MDFSFYFDLPLFVRLLLQGTAVILTLIPLAAACSMAERKISAWIQGRPGPNRAIAPFLGRGFPASAPSSRSSASSNSRPTAVNSLFKEDPIPGHVNKFYFVLAPILSMIPALTTVAFVPFGAYLDAAGKLVPDRPRQPRRRPPRRLRRRLARRLLAHPRRLGLELEISLPRQRPRLRPAHLLRALDDALRGPRVSLVNAPGTQGTLSLRPTSSSFRVPARLLGAAPGSSFLMPVSAFIFLVALFAETNRQPFDMPESEADLVGGFHTEYGAFKWVALLRRRIRAHDRSAPASSCLLFLGGWNPLPWVSLETAVNGWPQASPVCAPRIALRRHPLDQRSSSGRSLLDLLLHVGALDAPALPLRPSHEDRLADPAPALHRQPHLPTP